MVDKWAILLARGTPRYFGEGSVDQAVPLGHHHQRGVVLPMAITERGGPVTFNVGSVAGCSSVLAVNTSTTWGKWCAQSPHAAFTLPCTTLHYPYSTACAVTK